MTDKLELDLLVVGAGAAGLRAAFEASRAGVRAGVAVKGRLGAIGTRGAGASAAGVSEIGLMRQVGYTDQWSGEWDGAVTRADRVYGDILQAGLGMADPALARTVVDEAAAARDELEGWGMVPTFAHGYGVKTHGVPIVVALESQVRRSDVTVLERTAVTRILTAPDGSVCGAMAVNEKTGRLLHIRCPAVILAAGGMGRVFAHSFHTSCVTGDSYSLALGAGAELMNIEFNQIFVGTTAPTVNLVGSWLWKASPAFTNAAGEPFLESAMPEGVSLAEAFGQRRRHTPFSTRDPYSRYVDVGICREVKAGRGTPSDGVFVTVEVGANNGPFADVGEWYRYRGIHWDRGPVEVGIFHHCSNGGIRVDLDGATRVRGLYAIGEAAAGAHGADRLGGMMLVESQVYGKRSAQAAAQLAGSSVDDAADQVREEEAVRASLSDGSASVNEAWEHLGRTMWEELLAERHHEGLGRALDTARHLQTEVVPRLGAGSARDVVQAFELRSACRTAQAVALAALSRTESRGGHYRSDFPTRDDETQLSTVLLRAEGEGLTATRFDVDPEWRERTGDFLGEKWG